MDRIHAYLPGWEVPKIDTGDLAEGPGLTSGFLAECLHRLRRQSLTSRVAGRAALTGNLKKRDRDAALKTASGLLKLIYPGLVAGGPVGRVEDVPRPVLRWALWLAAESRLRVRQQQHRIQPEEFEAGDFRMEVDPASQDTDEERVFLPEEQPR
jgi:ATP-dependent Lon protease